MSKRAHLYYIDGLRVLGTIAVFVYHLNDQLITLNENYGVPLSPAAILPTKAFGIGLGQAAVALFFVISGFVLMYTTSDSRLDVSRYAKRRILDIFPFFYSAYIVAFFIVALAGIRLIQGPLSAWKLIFTIFGLDGYLSCYPSPFSPNWYLVGEWYLGCLILLYCFFLLFISCRESRSSVPSLRWWASRRLFSLSHQWARHTLTIRVILFPVFRALPRARSLRLSSAKRNLMRNLPQYRYWP